MAQGEKNAHATSASAVQSLADWAVSVRNEDISDAAFAQSKLLLLDTIGCGFPAHAEETGQAVLQTIIEIGGVPRCSVIGSAWKTSLPNAVLANGVLVRTLDLNDYVIEPDGSLGGHPSDNIPVALAAGEFADRSGRDILAAIILGYEVFAHFRQMMQRPSVWDGVSVSGVAAPVIAGRLLGLDRRQLAHAIALSLSRTATSAIVRSGDISSAKSLANALVAQNGVQAALLAKQGLTGPLAILNHPRGMKSVFPNTVSFPGAATPAQADAYVMRAHVKAYPCVATAQAAIAAGLEMHRVLDAAVDRLRRIRVTMADYPNIRAQQQDASRLNPLSREAADHSFTFLIAVSLIDGAFGPAQFENDRWMDPKVRDVMGRLEFATDPDLSRRAPLSYPCAIEVEAGDGRVDRVEVLFPPGFSRNGLDPETVIEKFRAVTAGHLHPVACDSLIDGVMELDASQSCLDFRGQTRAAEKLTGGSANEHG